MAAYELSETDLESALKLSTAWEFETIRQCAISSLEKLPLRAVRAIQLAHLYGMDHWIAPHISRLVFRPGPLTLRETELIGLKTAVKVNMLRDKFHKLSLELVGPALSRSQTKAAQGRILREMVSSRRSTELDGFETDGSDDQPPVEPKGGAFDFLCRELDCEVLRLTSEIQQLSAAIRTYESYPDSAEPIADPPPAYSNARTPLTPSRSASGTPLPSLD